MTKSIFCIITLSSMMALTAHAGDLHLTDEAVTRLHAQLNDCDLDAKENGITQHQTCSEIQHTLMGHYKSYPVYRAARTSHQ